jgi:hypothetical protein
METVFNAAIVATAIGLWAYAFHNFLTILRISRMSDKEFDEYQAKHHKR